MERTLGFQGTFMPNPLLPIFSQNTFIIFIIKNMFYHNGIGQCDSLCIWENAKSYNELIPLKNIPDKLINTYFT